VPCGFRCGHLHERGVAIDACHRAVQANRWRGRRITTVVSPNWAHQLMFSAILPGASTASSSSGPTRLRVGSASSRNHGAHHDSSPREATRHDFEGAPIEPGVRSVSLPPGSRTNAPQWGFILAWVLLRSDVLSFGQTS